MIRSAFGRRAIPVAVMACLTGLGVSAELRAQSPAPHIANADEPMLRRLLRARAFKRLEVLLAAYADSVRRDIAAEPLLINSFVAFQIPDPTLRPLLDAWVASESSASAYTARAAYFVGLGAEARGTEYASETSASQFDAMRNAHSQALADIRAALARDSAALGAHALLQSVARHHGDVAENRRILDRALKFAPASLLLRTRYMHSLTPRWGGSHEIMRRFAEESQRFAAANPQLRILRGFVAWDEGYTLWLRDANELALQKFTEALSYGEYWEFRLSRARVLYELDREAEAVADYTRALDHRPQLAEALAGRALAYWYLSDKVDGQLVEEYERRAYADLARAIEIDPSDDYVRYVVRTYPELLRAASPQ